MMASGVYRIPRRREDGACRTGAYPGPFPSIEIALVVFCCHLLKIMTHQMQGTGGREGVLRETNVRKVA